MLGSLKELPAELKNPDIWIVGLKIPIQVPGKGLGNRACKNGTGWIL